MVVSIEEYARRVRQAGPPSPIVRDGLWAFCVGGSICLLGELFRQRYLAAGADPETAGTLTSCTLILLSGILTTLGWYQKLASKAGAGSLVPMRAASPAPAPRCSPLPGRSSSTAPWPLRSTGLCGGWRASYRGYARRTENIAKTGQERKFPGPVGNHRKGVGHPWRCGMATP